MPINNKKIIIAVDGHSSCGKSTVAKELAKKLGYLYLDSGAMYRAVTLYALRNNLINNVELNIPALISKLDEIHITFKFNPESQSNDTLLNGENIEDEIRQLTVSQNVSRIAAIPEVRSHLVALQKEMGKFKGIVMDGRDIGTVVFPEAELKIFMTASPDIRAKRRYDELTAKGNQVDYEEIKANIVDRDHYDENREISPLRKAEDALVLDNSQLSREAQLAWALSIVNDILLDKDSHS
jgi:CMP/dCMP kinase